MSTIFLRPDHLHTPERVISATSESGLVAGGTVPTSTNAGQLRIGTAGTPIAAVDAVVRVQTGGNPTGYQPPTGTSAPGCSVQWRNATDSTSQYRGFVDRQHLVRVEFPLAVLATYGIPSTPRTLADGALGFLVPNETSGVTRFIRVASPGSLGAPSTVGTASAGAMSLGYRPDFVVLPSGRLVAITKILTTITTLYSDDHGATWAQLGQQSNAPGGQVVCAEYLDDVIVLLIGQTTSATVSILLSLDGGASFSLTGTSSAGVTNPRTCVSNGRILVSSANNTAGNLLYVYPLAAGGGDFGDTINTGISAEYTGALVTSDDGSVWAYGWSSGTDYVRAEAAVSTDGGATWTSSWPSSAVRVIDTETAAYANQGYIGWAGGQWYGKNVLVANVDSASATDDTVHMLTFGGWESVPESASERPAGEHCYLPIDYPENLSMARVNVGAGATISTNAGPLNIVATGANNSEWRTSAAQWTTGAAGTRRVRFRFRINSGGSISFSCSRLQVIANANGATEQELLIRFSATQMRIFDSAGTTLATVTDDMTVWHDLRIDLVQAVGAGFASVWYRKDTDAIGLWTAALTQGALVDVVGATDLVRMGGSSAVATNWDIAYLGMSETGLNSAGMSNPSEVAGRCLSASNAVYALSGVHLTGRNGNATPGDTYDLDTTYSYSRANIWRELRPSRHHRSTADNASHYVVFDAGANNRFYLEGAALIGTNFKSCTLQLNNTDTWGAPSQTISLDAQIESGTVGASNRGPGYFGFDLMAVTTTWRAGQFKSATGGRRYFVRVNSVDYEITDNTPTRLLVEGVDFSAATGTYSIYADRMGSGGFAHTYRYMRLNIGAQQTADDYYRVGTMVTGVAFTPASLYDHGFVDRIEPKVEVTEVESGYRASVRRGPPRQTLAVQWAPIAYAGPQGDLELRLRDFYRAIEGSHQPVVFWRDTNDVTSLGLYRIVGVYSATNVWGEGTTALTRVDQLILEEEL